jgi:hypothetical protein
MQLLEKKTKCPLCGAKNEIGASRCSICTRPLNDDLLPTQAVYQEALWASKIATPGSRRKTNPYLILVTVLAVAVTLNYFVLGFGPSWAHEPEPAPKGFGWVQQMKLPGYRVDMPGIPLIHMANASGTSLQTARVWVDSNWDLLRDQESTSVAAVQVALKRLHAGIVTASGPAPANPASAVSSVVAALNPDGAAQLADGGVTELRDPAFGQQFDLVTEYRGWPEEADTGTVRARVIVVGGKMFVAATFVKDGDDPALQQRLVSAFSPDH